MSQPGAGVSNILVYWIQLDTADSGVLTRMPLALTVPKDCTVADALAFIPEVAPHAESLLKHKRIAVFGLYALPNTQLHEGDRIEILDELRFNPMDSRRRRAAHREKLRRSEGQKQVRRSRKQRNPV